MDIMSDDNPHSTVVARIVRAYEEHDAEQERIRKQKKEEALRLQQAEAASAASGANDVSSVNANTSNSWQQLSTTRTRMKAKTATRR